MYLRIITFAAATASWLCASLYSLAGVRTLPVLASTSIAVADVPSMATDLVADRMLLGREDMRSNNTLQ